MSHILLKTTDGTVLAMEEGSFGECVERHKSTLAGLYLRHSQLFGVDLSWAQLQRSMLLNVNFTGSNLQSADFTDAVLAHCRFAEVDLRRAVFLRTNVSRASFAGANLEHCVFRENITYKTDFTGAKHWEKTDWAYKAKRELGFVFAYLSSKQKSNLRAALETGKFNGKADGCFRHEVLQLTYTGYPVESERGVQKIIPDYTPGLHNVGEQLLWQIKYSETIETSPFAKFVYDLLV